MPHVTQVNKGIGTLLQVSIATVMTTVAQRVTITGPSMEVDSIEKTTLDDTSKRYRPGLADGGEVSGTLYYDPLDTTHLQLFSYVTTPAIASWQLKFNDATGSTMPFSGFLTKLEPNGMEEGSNLGADFTIKLDGLPTTPS